MLRASDFSYSATATATDVRMPSTAVLGISSADRHLRVAPTGIEVPEWDPLVTYDVDDEVRQGANYFRSLITANIGNDPLLTLDSDWVAIDEPVGYVSRGSRGTPFDFTINNRGQLLNGFFTRCAVTEFSFTYAIPTITARNNRLCIKVRPNNTGSVLTFFPSIANGFYTVAQLAAAIQVAVRATNASMAGFTMTVDAPSGSFLAASNNTTTFAFVPVNALNPASGITGVLRSQYNAGRTQLFDQIGGAVGSGTLSSEYTLATSVQLATPYLLSTKFIDVVCAKLTANQASRDGSTSAQPRDILCRIYLEAEQEELNPEALGSQPFRVYRDFANPKQIAWDPAVPIAGLEFQLFDDQGFALSTYNAPSTTSLVFNDKDQPDWAMSLLCSEN